MKKIFTIIAVISLLLASQQVFSVTNTWDGSSSTSWTVAANWSLGHVPLLTEDVVIPSGPANQPVINGTSTPVCANLTVYSGATLTISATSTANALLTVGGTATFNGGFSIGGLVAKTGKIVATNIVWNSSATLSAFLGARCEVSGNWTFSSGSYIDMGYCWVTFTGTGNSTITNNSANSKFSSLTLGKTATAITYIGAASLATLTFTGTLTINASNTLNCAANITTILQSNLVSNGLFKFDYGTVSLERASGTQEIQLATTGNYFNSLKINCGGTVTLNNSLAIQGTLTIQTGTFNPQNNTVYVTGNWINTAGPAYFTEGTGKVVFNVIINKDGGKDIDQVIQNSENFNILELNNAYGDLVINNASVVVTCNQYDWVAGGLDVSAGSFTALDLADSGIFGRYTLSGAGTINLTNDDGWVDLNGTTLNISGGNFNVYGGTTDSYWPYLQNTSITMSGGILNFAETGIRVNASTPTLTSNITGGTIKTAKNFSNYRSDFNPTGGTIELYGPTDANLYCVGTAALYGLNINKTAAKGGENSAIVYPRIDRETGEVITDESRAQIVSLTSPVTFNGNFTLSGGTFNSNNNTIQAKRDWTNNVGPGSFNPGTGRVIFNGGNYHQVCYNETFNILEVAKASGGAFRVNSGTVNCGQYDWTIGSIDVLGGTFTASDLYENGIYGGFYVNPGATINLYQDIYQYVDLNGNLTFTNGGTINVYGGSGDSQWASGANASITMNAGTLDFKDKGITLTNLSPNTITENITGGTIRTTGGFFCNRTDFTPVGGLLELYGSNNVYLDQYAGTLKDIRINKGPSAVVTVNTNITVASIEVAGGTMSAVNKIIIMDGHMYVQNGGIFSLGQAAQLKIATDMSVNVNSGGIFKAIGTSANQAIVTRSGSFYYFFNINDGGTISAKYARFEYPAYIILASNAIIDPAFPFDYCTFSNGQGTYIFMNNSQELTIHGANFPTLPPTNTVAKVNNAGRIIFRDATGAYAGPAYEYDPYNRIDWTYTQPGLWTGAVSTDWNIAGNWDDNVVPTSVTNVTIPTGVVNMPVIGSGTANCNNLTLNGTLTMGNAILQVAGNAAMNGIFAMNHAAGQFIVQGDVDWNSGSTVNITASSVIHAYGHWNFNTGANAQLGNGSVLFKGSSSKYIRSYSADCSFWNLVSNKTELNSIEFYNLSTQPITVNGTLTTEINSKFVSSCGQDIKIRGNMVGNGIFQCTAGWVILKGASQVITPNSNDYFNSLEFNQTGTVTIGNTYTNILNIRGGVKISSGVFDAAGNIIKVGSSWNNIAGPAAFVEGTSQVIFNGNLGQQIHTNEDFNIVEVNKPSGEVLINGPTVTCNSYNWTAGLIKLANGGVFTANDLADNGVFGDYDLQSGAIVNLHQDIYQYVDINGSLHIEDGCEINIYGGNGWSQWASGANTTLFMNGGALDFKDQGININLMSPYTLTINVTGGTIRTSSGFFCNRADFTPAGGTIELYGTNDAGISLTGGSLWGLKVNKEPADSRSNTVTLETDVTVNGPLTIDAGTLKVTNKVLTTSDYIAVNTGGTLWMDVNSQLKIASSKTLNVNSGGTLKAIGLSENQPVFNRNGASGYYFITVFNGGTIEAKWANFYYVNPLRVYAGATINPAYPFDNCKFRYCNVGMLQIENSQDLVIRNVEFLGAATGFNVSKTVNNGSLIFRDATGDYSGAAHENDPYNRIDWIVTQPGLWTGAVSTDWNTAGNWDDGAVPTAAVNVTIPSSAPNMPVIATHCQCNNLTLNGTLTINGAIATVNGNATISGNLTLNSEGSWFAVMGDLTWNAGSTANQNDIDTEIYVCGHFTFNAGSNVQLNNGAVRFAGTLNKNIINHSATSLFYNLVSDKTSGAAIDFAAASTQPLRVNGNLVTEAGAKLTSSSSLNIELMKNLVSYGTIELEWARLVFSGVNQYIQPNVNDYFYHLNFNQSGTVTINTSNTNVLQVRGGITILSGVFNAGSSTIKVHGSWSNQVGSGAFIAGNSRVIFEGFLMSHIYYDETFNILEVNKDAGVIMINSTEAVCNVFDWTKGQVKVANGGIFTADDLADDGIFADFDLQSGSTVNLHQDIYQRVDFGGQLAIADGSTVNVHGGNGWSQWPYGADATLYMTDGTLDFKDQGINVNALSPNTLTLDLTGGIIRTPVGFFCNRPDFDPEPATLEIYGIGNSSIDLQSGQLWNININKSGTEDEVLINSDLTANSVVVNSGVLKSTPNSNLIFKNAYAYDNGTIWLTQGTDIKIKSSNEFAANGGNFKFMGEPDNYVSIGKHGTNLINLYVGNGGNISARYTHFSDLTGALIMNDGIVNPDHAFTGCIFENGFYCLMQIDNNQDLTIQDAHFPTASAPYNAAKYSDQGSVTFINATGAFAGEAFEDDPHNRIHWIVPQPGLWTGAVSTDWFTAGNWDDGNVPATSTNVTIPAGCPNYPVISGAAAVCDDMDINTGASLTVGNNTLTAGGDVYIYGLLTMTNASAVMDAYRIYWMAGSSDNVTAGTFDVTNWAFYDGTTAKLGTGNTAYCKGIVFPTDADAEFGNLVAVPGWKLMGYDNKAYYPLRVAGNFTVQTSVNWSNFGVDLIVAGNSVIQNGGNLAFVSGADYYNAGTMDLAGTIYLSSGSVITCNGELTFPSTGYLNLGSDGQFLCNYNDASSWTYLNGRINMSGTSVFEMSQKSILISSTFNDNDLTGGTLRFGRSLSATNAGNFQLTGVLTEFISGNSGHYVNVVNGNYLHDMRVNKPSGTIQVIDNLIVKNNMVIDAGAITVSDKVITIGGNWTNNVGTSGFAEGTSRVIFNGSVPQFCSTEEFYILEIDKPAYHFYDKSESNIFCQIYDWTQGGMWIAGGSSFHAADLADDGIYGDFVLWWNSIELHQDASQSIDLHGNISVNGGEFRVYGGNDQSLWGTNANASLYMGDGVLDFVDQGIKIQDAAPYSFTSDISGGTIRTQKSFIVQSPGFDPMGGTVELYGAQNSAILSTEGGAFYNITINKPADFSTRVSIWPSIVKNNFVVAEGLAEVGFGHELECWNSLDIQDGGWLAVNSATISMKYLSSVNVFANGQLSLYGYEGAMCRVKGIEPGEQYTFSILSGGTIEAAYTIFETLPEQGVYIAPGGIVNPSYSFTNCEFRNGMSGPTTLLSIDSDQDIIIENAVFPANTWGGQYNVRKQVDAGSVTFVYPTGDFAGEAYDDDPYNRIHWIDTLAVTAIATPQVICAGSSAQLDVIREGGLAPYTYLWSPADGLSDPEISNPTASPLISATYFVTVTDALGQIATSEVFLPVNPLLPVSVNINTYYNPAPPGSLINFTATPVNGGDVPFYQWKVNGVDVGQNFATYSFHPLNGDQINCILTSNAPCVSGNPATSNTITMIMVPASITVSGDILNGKDTCFNAYGTITVPSAPETFNVYAGGSATFIAGIKIRFLPGTWVKPGGYMNAYITTTNEYCGNLPSSMVTVVSGEGEQNVLPEQASHRYSIYPNPTTGNFTLLHLGDFLPGTVQVEIFNMHGERIFSTTCTDERSHHFTLSGLPAGICFVKVMTGDHVESFKLVITTR